MNNRSIILSYSILNGEELFLYKFKKKKESSDDIEWIEFITKEVM